MLGKVGIFAPTPRGRVRLAPVRPQSVSGYGSIKLKSNFSFWLRNVEVLRAIKARKS